MLCDATSIPTSYFSVIFCDAISRMTFDGKRHTVVYSLSYTLCTQLIQLGLYYA